MVNGEWRETRVYPTSSGVCAYVREISGRKRKELERDELLAALHESEERYRELFESESDALLLIDQETGSVLEANQAAVELYGYSTGTARPDGRRSHGGARAHEGCHSGRRGRQQHQADRAHASA